MRIFRKFINIIILLLLVIVQVALAGQLSQYGISMDIILVAVIALTLREGLYYGMVCGFFAGMLFDLLSQHIVGTSALLYAVIAFLVVRLMEAGFKKVITAYIFIVFAATELHIIIFNLIYYLFNFNINMAALSLEIMIKPVMNIILLFLIFPLIGVVIPGEDYFEYKYKEKA
jgi:rod shape-determining protein MreD